jgi:RNA polymerase-binding transcription factor
MDQKKLEHFRTILLRELAEHAQHVRDDQRSAIEGTEDGVKDSLDMSIEDVNKEIAFKMGERESQMVTDIKDALRRIDDGTYGKCQRCGRDIDERRLEALPTARYDAECQAKIESEQGNIKVPSL